MPEALRGERGVLVLSLAAALLMALLGIGFAVVTSARAIMLDGVFNAVYVGIGLATLRIERLAREPDNARFPFGHAYLESLVNAGKGLLILGISALALGDAILAIIGGGRAIVADLAIGYALIALGLCSATALVLRRAAQVHDSPLVRTDAENWLLNAVVSAAVLGAFSLGPVFAVSGLGALVPYIDPVLVAVVVVLFVGVPVRMARGAIGELVNRAPGEAVERPVTEAIDGVLERLAVRERHVRMVRPGRTLYVVVHVVLAEDAGQTLADLDRVRAEIDAAVRRRHRRVLVDVLFTADPRWAAPSAGEVAPVQLPGGPG